MQKKRSEGEQEILLSLLEQVEGDDSRTNQDRFARQVGIAKGLANAYFNRCLQKGWIRLRQVPKQRFLQLLDPERLCRKSAIDGRILDKFCTVSTGTHAQT